MANEMLSVLVRDGIEDGEVQLPGVTLIDAVIAGAIVLDRVVYLFAQFQAYLEDILRRIFQLLHNYRPYISRFYCVYNIPYLASFQLPIYTSKGI